MAIKKKKLGRPKILKDPVYSAMCIERTDMNKIRRIAKRRNVSQNALVREVITAYIKYR